MRKIKFEHTPILVINIHSMVDLITNSSTELFVCDTDKSLDLVKAFLKQNKDMKGYEEPWVFNIDEYRKWRVKERERKANWKMGDVWTDEEYNNPYHNIEGWFYDDEDEEDLTYLRKQFIENGYSRDFRHEYHPYEDRIRKELLKYKENDRYKGMQEIVDQIYDELLEMKEFSRPEWWFSPLKYHRYNDGIPVRKLHNCIIIMGDGDNSIPYDEFCWIEKTFNAKSFHLG